MKSLFITSLLILSCACAQKQVTPSSTPNWKNSLPKDYAVLDSLSGDFNADGTLDWIMVAHSTLETDPDHAGEYTPDEYPRQFNVYLGTATGNYILQTQNSDLIVCDHCGIAQLDGYGTMSFVNGHLLVNQVVAGGSNDVTAFTLDFIYDAKIHDFVLTTFKTSSFTRTDPSAVTDAITTPSDFGVQQIGKVSLAELFSRI